MRRPGVFFSAKIDGYLDVWDYYEKQNEPVLSHQARSCALLCTICPLSACWCNEHSIDAERSITAGELPSAAGAFPLAVLAGLLQLRCTLANAASRTAPTCLDHDRRIL